MAIKSPPQRAERTDVLVIDKYGNQQTLAWLFQNFGPLEILTEGNHYDGIVDPAFRLVKLVEVDDLPNQKAANRPEAAASIRVQVLDIAGKPVPGVSVVWWYSSAPQRPGAGHLEQGDLGTTNGEGVVAFAMGRGAYYDPASVKGPHDVWLFGPGMSERVSGLGMIAGTNHRHLDITFQRAKDTEPDPSTADKIRDAISLLRQAVDILYKALSDIDKIAPIPM
jgi:hypothetical protein